MPRKARGTDNRVLAVCRLLNRRRAKYVIAGGVAANLHGSVRATKDVDILVPRRDVANTRRILDALSDVLYGLAKELSAEEVAARPITIVGDDPRVDVLTVAWPVSFERAWKNRVVRTIAGVRVPYLAYLDSSVSGLLRSTRR